MNAQQLDALCAAACERVAEQVRQSAAIAAAEVARDFYWLRQRLVGPRVRHRQAWMGWKG